MKTKIGATGKFPDGKLSPDDEGELVAEIVADPARDLIVINFGKPVRWLSMPRANAIDLAKILLEKAGVKKVLLDL